MEPPPPPRLLILPGEDTPPNSGSPRSSASPQNESPRTLESPREPESPKNADRKSLFSSKVLSERRSSAPMFAGAHPVNKRGLRGRRFSQVSVSRPMGSIIKDVDKPLPPLPTIPTLKVTSANFRRRMSNDPNLPKVQDLILRSPDQPNLQTEKEVLRALAAKDIIRELLAKQLNSQTLPHETTEQIMFAISKAKEVDEFIDIIADGCMWFTDMPTLCLEIRNKMFMKDTEVTTEEKMKLIHLTIKLVIRYQHEIIKAKTLQIVLDFVKPCLQDKKLEYHAKVLIDDLTDNATVYVKNNGALHLKNDRLPLFLALARMTREQKEDKVKLKKADELLQRVKEDKEVDEEELIYSAADCKNLFQDILQDINDGVYIVNADDVKQLSECLHDLSLKMFQAIHFKEFQDKNWSRANSKEIAPNIYRLSAYFEKISKFVSLTILNTKDAHRRSKLLGLFIRMSYYSLDKLLDFNTSLAIYTGVTSTPIERLKETYSHLTEKCKKKLNALKDKFRPDGNFQQLRDAINLDIANKRPFIPPMFVLLKDITTTDENKEFLDIPGSNRMINIKKLELMAKLFSPVLYNQRNLKPLQKVTLDISALIETTVLDPINDGKYLTDLSKKIEPNVKSKP
jgi:hypothetical protein